MACRCWYTQVGAADLCCTSFVYRVCQNLSHTHGSGAMAGWIGHLPPDHQSSSACWHHVLVLPAGFYEAWMLQGFGARVLARLGEVVASSHVSPEALSIYITGAAPL